ncbi:hypothetical protein DFH27DRAFT_483527 [Peziza echinospora]|nr:hypothetical protein DFH27DRAFT_483527 [Peziza echinospora]
MASNNNNSRNNNKQPLGGPAQPASPSAEEELASFRRQWQAEVRQRAAGPGASAAQTQPPQQHPKPRPQHNQAAASSSSRAGPPPIYSPSPAIPTGGDPNAPDLFTAVTFDGTPAEREAAERRRRKSRGERTLADPPSVDREGITALEHFENALAAEGTGKLGPSLALYRKAYKMDPGVDTKYREKYFPKTRASASAAQPLKEQAGAPPPSPAGAQAAVKPVAAAAVKPGALSPLIASFAHCRIPAAEPPTTTTPETTDDEDTPRAFSLLARLPHELLLHALHYAAHTDLAALSKLSQVCKALAFAAATEETLWKDQACFHPRWGFGSQVHDFTCTVTWQPLPDPPSPTLEDEFDAALTLQDECLDVDDDAETDPSARPKEPTIPALLPLYQNSYRLLFANYPRIRYNGLYISTCNYLRPGAHSSTTQQGHHVNTGTLNPIHIVTYYRYIRFYPDGTALTLLTLNEPLEVVYTFTKANVPAATTTTTSTSRHHHHNHNTQQPSSPWQHDLRKARWRVTGGELVDVETEGVPTDRFEFRMQLALGSVGRRQRGNRLAWKGYWAWNRVSGDLAEFGLRNDKPFFWSRVASWGEE